MAGYIRMKTISIVTGCFNEEENVEELYTRVRNVMAEVGRYRYEHIFIDNSSSDRTVEVLKRIAAADTNVRVIVNARNFGHIRSPMHGLFQARGDAIIGIVADLQDPPEMIPQFLEGWEQGAAMVLAIKNASEENRLMFWIRKMYYRLVNRLSSIETFENFTGFGLYRPVPQADHMRGHHRRQQLVGLLHRDFRRLALDHLFLDAADRRRRVEDDDMPLHQPVEEAA